MSAGEPEKAREVRELREEAFSVLDDGGCPMGDGEEYCPRETGQLDVVDGAPIHRGFEIEVAGSATSTTPRRPLP